MSQQRPKQYYRGPNGNRNAGMTPAREPTFTDLVGLIALNVAVFIGWNVIKGDALGYYALNFLVSANSVLEGRVWTLATSGISHMDVNHLLFNMIGLWVFGRPIAALAGRRDFHILYWGGAITASLGHVAYSLAIGSPSPALGASGAVMALAICYAMAFPNRTLLVGFFIPMKAPMAVGLFILFDIFGAIGAINDGIAHAAHLGGAVFGGLFWWWRTRRTGGRR